MRELYIVRKGQIFVAVIDDDDWAKVSEFNWFIKSTGYAFRNMPTGNLFLSKRRGGWEKEFKPRYLHHDIFGKPSNGLLVDHINGNKLDNRKENLRLATNGQNKCNQGPMKNNQSGYNGVYLFKSRGKYVAEIRFDNVKHFLGYFDSPIQAAKAYDAAAIKLHGEFAKLNFPAYLELGL